jgi:hypothetical protein
MEVPAPLTTFLMRRDLTPADYWKLTQCWALLLPADLALRVLPFRQLERLARSGAHRGNRQTVAEAAEVRRLDQLVRIAARRHLYPMTCLRRSLVLQWLLARAGISVELKLGVRRDGAGIAAHAWIEYLGEPIGEPDEIAEYARFQLPEQSR